MGESDCVFCRIVTGEMGTSFLVEGEHVVAFDDIAPLAPTHILIVPRQHVRSVADIGPGSGDMLSEIVSVTHRLAQERGIANSGYRLLTNHGADAGQTVHHLHFHLLGGRELGPLA